jgi:hypothetical protein
MLKSNDFLLKRDKIERNRKNGHIITSSGKKFVNWIFGNKLYKKICLKNCQLVNAFKKKKIESKRKK